MQPYKITIIADTATLIEYNNIWKTKICIINDRCIVKNYAAMSMKMPGNTYVGFCSDGKSSAARVSDGVVYV